jgi:NADPH2:quinone reductase
VREAGAHEVVIGEDTQAAGAFGPYDMILESVGGASLATALEQLAPEGICISYGWSGSASSTIAIPPLVLNGRSSLQGFFLHRECEGRSVADGLAYLVALVGNGAMPVVIGAEASWDEMGQIAQQLIARSFAGKAILHLTTR